MSGTMYDSKKTVTATLDFYIHEYDLIIFVNIFLNKISIFFHHFIL